MGTDPLDPVAVGQAAEVSTGAKVWVTNIRDVQISGVGPGEINGPGVAVTIRIRNASETPLDLNGTAVNAFFGTSPASQSTAKPSSLLEGDLAPGGVASGVYVFQKPQGELGQLTIQVENSAWPDVVKVQQ